MLMKFIAKSLIALVYCMTLYPDYGIAKETAYDIKSAVSMARAQPHDAEKSGYVEYYLDDPVEDVVRATYRSTDGESLATKRLKFAKNGKLPTFELLDFRNSSGYRVMPRNDKLLVHTLRLLENNIQAVVDVREVTVVEPMVVDAGFHRFLLQHWDEIGAGKSVRFNFLQVDRARLVPLVVRRAACVKPQQFCVRVSLGNLLLRVLLPSVELTYDKQTKRLLRYSGLGPLPTKSGDAFPVVLSYQYLP